MDRSSEQEALENVAAKWVDNLRSRFKKMGLPSRSSSDVGSDFPTSWDTEAVGDASTTSRNRRDTEGSEVFESTSSGDVLCSNIDDTSTIKSEHLHSSVGCPSTDDGNSLSDDSEIVEMPTARTEASSSVDLERLRKRRLAYFRQDIRSDSEDTKSSNAQVQNLHNKTKLTGPISRNIDVPEDEFYTRPRRASSSSSWEKSCWTRTHDEAQSPSEPDDDVLLRSKSNEDNELILDWWGLSDLPTAPELRMYLSPSKNTSDTNSWKTINDSEKTINDSEKTINDSEKTINDSEKTINDSEKIINDSEKTINDSEKTINNFEKTIKNVEKTINDSENSNVSTAGKLDDFHVGFYKKDSELDTDSFQNGMSNSLYCSSDESSDFTLDDPIPKPKSPRVSSGFLFGNNFLNTPRYKSSLSQSTSPPVPQIKGSLYHEFSKREMYGASEEVPDKCTITIAETDEFVNLGAKHRPRSLSQPISVRDNGIFCPDGNNTNIEIVYNFQKQHGTNLEINCNKNNVITGNDVPELISKQKVQYIKTMEAKRDNVSHSFEDVLGSPRSDNELGTEKNSITTMRVCPDCNEINNNCVNWCIECGLALVNVKPVKQVSSTKHEDQTILESKKSSLNENYETECIPSEGNVKKIPWKEFKQNGRRWEKSSLAWNTYKDSHLSKPPGVKNFKTKSKSNFAATDVSGTAGRPRSASSMNLGKKGNSQNHNNQHCNVAGSCPKSHKWQESKSKKRNTADARNSSEMRVTGNKAMHNRKSTKKELSLDLTALDNYAEMIRSNRGNPLPYLCLPDEIILRIFSHLSHTDVARCSQVCQQLHRVCQDQCLWKTIVLKKNQNLCDEFLEKIGSRKPISLSLIQCRGHSVTSTGLRELFRRCAENLEELNFSGCNGGQLIGESILLHVALRCSKLRSVDASWSNVGDNGIESLVQNVERLECLCMNGCQAITDNSLKVIADKHGESLKTFEIFGCFNVSASAIKRLGQKCPNLQTLNLGQCYKITSSAIGQLVSHLESIVNLDLRGCKQAQDACVKTIAKHCPLLVNLVLANCPLITDVAITEIAINLPSVRCLDVCGCANVTDYGVRALARSCSRLNYLDLSSTSITQKSVMLLANYCSQNLESLKLSFCVHITDDSVLRLVKHCKRMTTLHLYGCKKLRNVEALQKLNHSLKLEF